MEWIVPRSAPHTAHGRGVYMIRMLCIQWVLPCIPTPDARSSGCLLPAQHSAPRGAGADIPLSAAPSGPGRGRAGVEEGGGGAALGGAAASLIARINNLSRLVSASNRQTSDVVFRRQQRPDQRSGPEGTIEDVNPHRGSEAPRPWDSGVPGRTEGFGAPTVRRCAPTPN